MNIFSFIKAVLLTGVDALNKAVSGSQPFTRAAIVDPSATFPDAMARRDAIAAAAEAELGAFMRSGVYVAQKPNDLGDCAIWQGVYTAMTVMRWKVQPTAETQAAMSAAAYALARYFYATGPGQSILVRGAMPQALEGEAAGGLFHVDPNNASKYFTDGMSGTLYTYREDASLDSLLGAMFGAAIVGRFGDAATRAILAGPLARFATGFQAAGYKLTNRNGTPTKYGNCTPGLTQAPVRTLAAALPSLVAGTDGWRAIAKTYGSEFATPDTQIPNKMSWVNAHLAILATLTYVCAAPADAPALEDAKNGLRSLMDKYADAGNSLLIHAAACLGVTPSASQKEKADKILLEFPLAGKPKASLNNSAVPALQPVPVFQRPPVDNIYQRSPYQCNGEAGEDYNRLDYLLPHYLSKAA